MTDVDLVTMPALANIPRVEIMHAGQWDLSTGRAYFTTDDLANAVAALDCPAVQRPKLKIGHNDQRFNAPRGDGEPTIGWVANMATTNNGQTLVGDFMGMPGWLGGILASAYPDRSIEGWYDWVCQIGHTHPFVLTHLALLGVSAPGIGTLNSLQDIAELYGVMAAESDQAEGTRVQFVVRAAAVSTQTGAMVALLPSETDVERLAVDGGEPTDQLHVTLRYLGKAADLEAEAQQQIIDAVTAIAAQTAPINGDGFSVALFNPTNPDRETCVALGVNGDGLDSLHDQIETAVDGLSLDLPAPMLPWTAHLTLEYTDDADQVKALVDRTGPITFDRLRVAFAGVATDIPLGGTPVAATRKDTSMPNPSPREVAAGVSTDDVRRQYYDSAPYSYWITQMQLEPLQLIVCDDDSGKTYRVGVTVDATAGTATFTDAVEVMVDYIDKPAPVAAGAKAEAPTRLVYASRGESRAEVKASEPAVEPTPEPAPADEPPTETPAAEPVQPPNEEDNVSPIPSGVASRLGLADDADEAAVLAALDATIAKAAEPAPVAAGAPKLPDGVVMIDKVQLDELHASAADGREARKQQLVEARDRIVDDAIKAGKIPPARRDHWLAQVDADREGAEGVLASLEPGLIPVTEPTGYPSTEDPAANDAEFDRLFRPTPDDTKGA